MKPRVRATLALAVLVVLLWAVAAAAGDERGSSDAPEASSFVALKTYLPVVLKPYERCPAAGGLISPEDGASLHTLAPLFRWNPVSHPRVTSYVLDTSLNREFTPFQFREWLGDLRDTHRMAANLPEATTIYWRVSLACGDELGPSSPVWSFTTGSGGVIPSAPSLVAPANGSTLADEQVTLQWAPVSGAVEYYVTWSRKDAYRYINRWVEGTQLTDDSFWSDTTYEWWVAARSRYAIGPDSPVWEFTTPAAAE